MKSVLLGNGFNIQFGGNAYTSSFIMKRIYFNARVDRYAPLFEGRFSEDKIIRIFAGLLGIANRVRAGEFDGMLDPDERDAIADFKRRYTIPIEHYHQIMLEDWFLLIRLFFHTQADLEPLWIDAKQGFNRMILDAIYNEGYLDRVHEKMNENVNRFFDSYDNIFTLNYDDNIEALTGREVYHLHGDYSVLADSENPSTVLGYIRCRDGKTVVIDAFRHCFCNALLDYSGGLKYKRAMDIKGSTSELRRLLEMSRSNHVEYEGLMADLKAENEQFYQIAITYIEHPELKIGSCYHFEKLKSIEGEIDLIGLSPNNDAHIFRCLNESNLDKIVMYYHSNKEKVRPAPFTKRCDLKSVKNLWKALDSERKIQNYNYPIPRNPEIDGIIEALNKLSFDEVTIEQTIDGANSMSQAEANRLCDLITAELELQKKRGAAKSDGEMMRDFAEISRVSLREGYLPSSVLLHYIMNYKKREQTL